MTAALSPTKPKEAYNIADFGFVAGRRMNRSDIQKYFILLRRYQIKDNKQLIALKIATMNKLENMAFFVRVAELGSFSAVAWPQGIARSIITRKIAQLEGNLGVKLMIRSTRSLTLTSAGSNYLEKCRVILNLVEEAENEFAEEHQIPRGNLRINVPLTY